MEFFDSLSFKTLKIWRLLVYARVKVRVRITVLTYILRDFFFFWFYLELAMSNSRLSTLKSSSSSSSSSPPSSSTFSLPSSDEDSLPYQKFACILVQGSHMALEWYVFNTSNDVEHNQAPPSSGPSPFLQAIFHLNSHQQLHIKPVVIVPSGSVLF